MMSHRASDIPHPEAFVQKFLQVTDIIFLDRTEQKHLASYERLPIFYKHGNYFDRLSDFSVESSDNAR